ncbi:NTP pyrophosphohydrolase [Streptomyces gamaensis]|uniref:NTP pyrophosphohydrolase n=1 Tax=Streptomyces gamaensis TaxID=1763542 RepID=A0ABW0Z698_9ACTN
MSALLVVDAANVVGAVPDGWWRDRRAAAERLRDALVAYATGESVPGGCEPPLAGPVEVVLVVEGAARGVESAAGVRVVAADGSGDDRIVEFVAEREAGRRCVVVTADRGLRERVRALGAEVVGPRAVRPEAGGGSGGGSGGRGRTDRTGGTDRTG